MLNSLLRLGDTIYSKILIKATSAYKSYVLGLLTVYWIYSN